MYSSKTIREALREGTARGYRLLPELRDAAELARLGRDPFGSRLAAATLRLARQAAETAPPPVTFEIFTEYERLGSRERYDDLLTRRLQELAALTLAAVLEDRSHWIGAIEERLWDLTNLYVWELNAVISLDAASYAAGRPHPRQNIGLLTAETAFQLAETLDLLGEALHPFLVYRVRQELAERVFEPYRVFAYWWQSASTNWQAVCSASIGCAALYCVQDEDELALLLGKVLQGLQSYLEGFDRDGVTPEGLDYWTYGFSSYVFFAELLRERTAGRLRLLEDRERAGAIAGFPRAITLSGGCVVNFSDCDEHSAVPRYLAARLGRRLGLAFGQDDGGRSGDALDAEAEAAAATRWSYLSRSAAWSACDEPAAERAAAAGMAYFPAAQWLVDKRTTEAGALIAFAAKGGHNDEPHNHNDLGHFILHVAGKNVMPDLGAPAYTRDTFSARRYEHPANSSRGHAVPIVDGSLQSPGRERRAAAAECRDDGRRTAFKLRLEDAYELPELLCLAREWDWHYAERTLRLKDVFLFATASHDIVETLLFKDEPRIVGPGRLEVDAGVCRLEVGCPAAANIRIVRESYVTRKGEQASVHVVALDIPCPGTVAEADIFIRIHLP